MSKFLIGLLLILISLIGKTQNIVFHLFLPSNIPGETATDFQHLLEVATGKTWTKALTAQQVKKGFVLTIADHPIFKTKESFRIQSNGTDLLTITSSSNEGLVFGFYKHLRTLGFKFYLPDDLYTIIPSVTNPFGAKKDQFDKPFLQIRNFAGTGGFGSINPDSDKSVEKAWLLWKTRNGFGAAYHLSGHRGEDFILENKAKLQQNPQWLASPLTNNYQSDLTTKINYFNKEAVDFFLDWTLKSFTGKNYKPLPPGHTDLISIEPSDGGGYLNDFKENANKKLPSISDQVYGMANLAAQKLDKLFPNHPNIGVNLYAYSTHADPPTFPLHSRVFVQLVPYQYQKIAFGPSFIKLWASKVKRFGIYDYLKYADAQFDVPGGITLDEAMLRLVHSVKSGSEGTTYETSYSKFSTGIMLWALGRYMADGDPDWKKNLSTLTSDLYGNAKKPIAEVFSLFYSQSFFNVNLLGNAVALVDQASGLDKQQNVQKRLDELKQYLHFAYLVYRSRDEANGTYAQRLVPVAEYAWKIYETKIIHSYRIMALISYAFLNFDKSLKDYSNYQKLHADWFPETERSKTPWSKISQSTNSKSIQEDFQILKNKYKSSALSKPYSFKDVSAEINSKYKASKSFIAGSDYTVRSFFGIYTGKATEVKINYQLTNTSSAKMITISSIDNSYTTSHALVGTETSGEFKFTIPGGENNFFINASDGSFYRIQVKVDDGIFYFDGAPRGIMGFYKSLSDPLNAYTYDSNFYPSYIFFPKGLQAVNYKVQLNALDITTPSGKKPTSSILQTEHAGFEIRKMPVDEKDLGKIWKTVITGNYNYSFLNIPDRYYLLQEK